MNGNINPKNDQKRSVIDNDLKNILSEVEKSIKPNVFSILNSPNGFDAYWNAVGTALDASETRNLFDYTGKIRLYNLMLMCDYKYLEARAYGSGSDDLFMHPYRSAQDIYYVLGGVGWLADWQLKEYDATNDIYIIWRVWGNTHGYDYNGEIKVDLYNPDETNSHKAYLFFAYGKQASIHIQFYDYNNIKYSNIDIHKLIMRELGLRFGDVTVEKRTNYKKGEIDYKFDIYIHKDLNDIELNEIMRVISKYTKVHKKDMKVIR